MLLVGEVNSLCWRREARRRNFLREISVKSYLSWPNDLTRRQLNRLIWKKYRVISIYIGRKGHKN